MEPGRLHPEQEGEGYRQYPSYDQDYPQDDRYSLVTLEQTQLPVIVQVLDQGNPLTVKRLLGARGGLEVLDGLHELVGQLLRVRASLARPAPRQQGPLIRRHDPGVGPAELLYAMTFRFGELSRELVKIPYRVGLVSVALCASLNPLHTMNNEKASARAYMT